MKTFNEKYPTLLDQVIAEKHSKLTFKKEWSEADFKVMEKKIASHFLPKTMNTMHGSKRCSTFFQVDKVLGLAYTSSGVHACYSICNTELHFDETHDYQFFIMTSDGVPYAELWDKDENERYIRL